MGLFGPKHTGNWAEDMGNDLAWLLKAGAITIVFLAFLSIVLGVLLVLS